MSNRADVLSLVETWAGEGFKYEINGFRMYSKTRIKEGKLGRNPGGITVFIRESKFKSISSIKNDCNECLWLKCDTLFKNSIILGVIYNPPVGSKYENRDFINMISGELSDLRLKYSGCNIILMGDWNARVGESNEVEHFLDVEENELIFGNSDMFDGAPAVEKGWEGKNSQDKVINKGGENLLDFCVEHSLIILNGRKFVKVESIHI